MNTPEIPTPITDAAKYKHCIGSESVPSVEAVPVKTALRLERELSAKTAECERLVAQVEACKKLVAKMGWVFEQPEYIAVWQMYQIHGGDYRTGPSFAEEFKAAKESLTKTLPVS